MPHFQKRGNRIRASDKSMVFRFSAGSLLLLFFMVVLLLNLKTIAATDWHFHVLTFLLKIPHGNQRLYDLGKNRRICRSFHFSPRRPESGLAG